MDEEFKKKLFERLSPCRNCDLKDVCTTSEWDCSTYPDISLAELKDVIEEIENE